MFRQGTYCLTRISRALKKPVQWEINMSQGQLLLYAFFQCRKREKERDGVGSSVTLDIILGDMYLLFHFVFIFL